MPETARSTRIDLRIPAIRDGLQAILDRPEVQEIQIEKPKPGQPVCLGVKRGGKYTWWFGATLLQAMTRAEQQLAGRAGIPAEVEAP
jgi:hypothetical protein